MMPLNSQLTGIDNVTDADVARLVQSQINTQER